MGGLCFFKLPNLNLEATDYIDLIDWSNTVVTEPPLTIHIKDKDLKDMYKEKQFPVLTFEEFPCHKQSVERCVNLISEAAMKVCNDIARHGYIPAKLQAMKELPTFDNKGRTPNSQSASGGAAFQALGRDFSVRSKANDILLHVDSREMVVSANNIIVSDSGGYRLDGSLETPLVRGSANKDLRLESVLKRVKVRSEKDMHVDSPAGGIFVTGLKNMNLRSTGGRVTVDSSRLQMRNLKTASQTPKEDAPHEVFQVCICDNGRIFLAHRQGYCQIQESVCRDNVSENFRTYSK